MYLFGGVAGVVGEWVRGLGLRFTNLVGTGGSGICVGFGGWCGGSVLAACARFWEGSVMLSMCEL